MAQRLRELAALAEDLGSIQYKKLGQLAHNYLQFQVRGASAHACMQVLTHTQQVLGRALPFYLSKQG